MDESNHANVFDFWRSREAAATVSALSPICGVSRTKSSSSACSSTSRTSRLTTVNSCTKVSVRSTTDDGLPENLQTKTLAERRAKHQGADHTHKVGPSRSTSRSSSLLKKSLSQPTLPPQTGQCAKRTTVDFAGKYYGAFMRAN